MRFDPFVQSVLLLLLLLLLMMLLLMVVVLLLLVVATGCFGEERITAAAAAAATAATGHLREVGEYLSVLLLVVVARADRVADAEQWRVVVHRIVAGDRVQHGQSGRRGEVTKCVVVVVVVGCCRWKGRGG